jgi:hypothetical protein
LGRLDIPLDAEPEFQAMVERVRRAVEKHGQHNSYYLNRARYVIHLTNDPLVGTLEFRFEGTVLTDADDRATIHADLEVELGAETCEWLTAPVVAWFQETVAQAVRVEFDRYIAAGDLERTKQRIARLQAESEARGGFLGMGL